MTDRTGIFAGDDPFVIARDWLAEASKTEPNDANAIALATVDAQGLPDVRMVLLKEIEGEGENGAFVFYTNFESAKGSQIEATGVASFVMHWKSLRRQIRVRGHVSRVEPELADAYYDSRALQSRIGAWASKQSRPLESRAALMAEAAKQGINLGLRPSRPPHWGGYRIRPVQIEFWADGAFRLHDRFQWIRRDFAKHNSDLRSSTNVSDQSLWLVTRLNP
ncbi:MULTISPECIES: pyridoxamine 5'-phosphate oxidase [Paracoccus]|jgi:pyridoxamine 5'-phosphate oxidase|uniref:Pyridoxamine 5'-phosphate oxidase n=1 Tax=Paracoccus litorisediminis TaxID=2006130 RepID=A0A844HII7_9RHOB|nr:MULTISPECIES: pyridoxamine 5'-phosphate oxidase [Paracoccus]MBD9525823.1 pyridoxamine 5'-phosphate oxidase [Paracoccus sp. PAR01]MTH58274.1 pyridoxamine 5'-phosphate oxidase [Paracoccus litorisediminis]